MTSCPQCSTLILLVAPVVYCALAGSPSVQLEIMQSYSVVSLARYRSAGKGPIVWSPDAGLIFGHQNGQAGTFFGGGATLRSGQASVEFHVHIATFSPFARTEPCDAVPCADGGARLRVWQDGTELQLDNSSVILSRGQYRPDVIQVGSSIDSQDGNDIAFEVAEVMLFNHSLDGEERARLDAFFSHHYQYRRADQHPIPSFEQDLSSCPLDVRPGRCVVSEQVSAPVGQHGCQTNGGAALQPAEVEHVYRISSRERCLNGGKCMEQTGGYACQCVTGFEGANCEQATDECASEPCRHGRCFKQDSAPGYRCTCNDGWEGMQCDRNIDECSGQPCANGGSCRDLAPGFLCGCEPGYIGDRCEIDVDDCASAPCQNNATCTDDVDGYSCTCLPGYTAHDCSGNIDDCLSAPCSNNGECVDLINDYRCDCLSGYEGETCGVNTDDCAEHQCADGSTCVDLINGYECACAPGLTGPLCEVEVNECIVASVPSPQLAEELSRSERQVELATQRLDDFVQYSRGKFLAAEAHVAEARDVQTDGTAKVFEKFGVFSARVLLFLPDVKAYVEAVTDAVTAAGSSAPTSLLGVANCRQRDSGGTMPPDELKTPEFAGMALYYRCMAETVLAQQSTFGVSDGKCFLQQRVKDKMDYAWTFAGLAAAADPAECAQQQDDVGRHLGGSGSGAAMAVYSVQVQGGGDGVTEAWAKIPPAMTQIEPLMRAVFDEIQALQATMAGLFALAEAAWAAALASQGEHAAFYGALSDVTQHSWRVQMAFDAQLGTSPCKNNATCQDHFNGYTCGCAPGWQGDACTVSVDDCASNPCRNGGTCSDRHLGFSCQCADGFGGKTCEEDMNACDSNPCAGGATCVDKVVGYECKCPEGKSGLLCLQDTIECASNPCQNQGVCSEADNGFACRCKPGYNGVFCEHDIDECTEGTQHPSTPRLTEVAELARLVARDARRRKKDASDGCSGDEKSLAATEEDVGAAQALLANASATLRYLEELREGWQGQQQRVDALKASLAAAEAASAEAAEKRADAARRRARLQDDLNNATYALQVTVSGCQQRGAEFSKQCGCRQSCTSTVSCSLCPVEYTVDRCDEEGQIVAGICGAAAASEYAVGLAQQQVDQAEALIVMYAEAAANASDLQQDIALALQSATAALITAPALAAATQQLKDASVVVGELQFRLGTLENARQGILAAVALSCGLLQTEQGNLDAATLAYDSAVAQLALVDTGLGATDVRCHNGGRCLDAVGGFTCECPPGWAGSFCETEVDHCASDLCMGGGTCAANPQGGFYCRCPAGRYGEHCEEAYAVADACRDAPCRNGGTCRGGGDGFVCECPAGFKGHTCNPPTTVQCKDILKANAPGYDPSTLALARSACSGCSETLGTLYWIDEEGQVDDVLSGAYGRQQVKKMMREMSEELFSRKAVRFTLQKMPRRDDIPGTQALGIVERVCLSARQVDADFASMSSALLSVFGFDMAGAFPDTSALPDLGIIPGWKDFREKVSPAITLPLQFSMFLDADAGAGETGNALGPERRRRQVSACHSSPCQNGGSCYWGNYDRINNVRIEDIYNWYRCACPEGVIGTHCEHVLPTADVCKNSGEFRVDPDSPRGYTCSCQPDLYFAGEHCDQPVNMCLEAWEGCNSLNCRVERSPCSTEGTIFREAYVDLGVPRNIPNCIYLGGLDGFRCNCKPGYHGQRCDHKVSCPACEGQQGFLSCEAVGGAGVCVCKAGFGGQSCRTKLSCSCDGEQAPCEEVRCTGNTQCKTVMGSPQCTCNGGFSGLPSTGCTVVKERNFFKWLAHFDLALLVDWTMPSLFVAYIGEENPTRIDFGLVSIGIAPSSDLSFANIPSIKEHFDGFSDAEKFFLSARLHYVQLHADSGARVGILQGILMKKLGGTKAWKSMNPTGVRLPPKWPPSGPEQAAAATQMDKMKQLLGGSNPGSHSKTQTIKEFVDPRAYTYNIFFDFILGSTPPEIGWMFSLHLRVEIINVLNQKTVKRSYCEQIGTWGAVDGCSGDTCEAFKVAMPTPRQVNVELAGSWAYAGLQFEVGVRLENNKEFVVSRANLAVSKQGESCKLNSAAAELNFAAARSRDNTVANEVSQRKQGFQFIVFLRLPVLTIKGIVCLAYGGSADVIDPNNQADDGSSQSCDTTLQTEVGVAGIYLLKVFGPFGIKAPQKPTQRSNRNRMGTGAAGTSGAKTGAQLTYYHSLGTLAFDGVITWKFVPLLPIHIVLTVRRVKGKSAVPFAKPAPAAAGPGRRRRAAAALPLVVGIEFTSAMLLTVLKEVGADEQWVIDGIEMIGGYLDFSIGLVYSRTEVNRLVTPEAVPALQSLSGMVIIPTGAMVVLSTRLPFGACQPCPAPEGRDCRSYQFCSFVRKYLGDPTLSAWVSFGGSGITIGAAISNIILARDSCDETAGWAGRSLTRPAVREPTETGGAWQLLVSRLPCQLADRVPTGVHLA